MAGRIKSKSEPLHPLGYEQILDLSSATPLSVPVNADTALVIPTADVVWRDDGVDPTAAVGMPLAAGQTILYDGDLSAIRFILVSASAQLNVSYYR